MAQTNRVIIHHEGGGKPRDEWACIDAEPYSIAIGSTRIEVRNSPNDSFITSGTSGHSLQICLTGNRDNYPVTDNDLKLIDEACDVAQSKGWIPAPGQRTCQFHGDTAETACPGSQTRARRDDIYAVVKGGSGPTEDDDEMKESDFDRIAADTQRIVVDVLRKEGVSGAAGKADTFSEAEKSDIQRIVTDVLRKEGVSSSGRGPE